MRLRDITDYQSSEPSIADENVGTQPEDEIGYIVVPRGEYGVGERIGRRGLEEEIGRTTNAKRGVRSEWLVSSETLDIESRRNALESFRIKTGHWE